MGLLSSGTPLSWKDAQKLAEVVKREGVEQLVNILIRVKDRKHDCLRWGDEVEYILVRCDEDRRKCAVSIRAEEILAALHAEMKEKGPNLNNHYCFYSDEIGFTANWHPEYGRYMLEGTPANPYRHDMKDLLCVEYNMICRRRQAESLLLPFEHIISMGNFPRLGCPDAFSSDHPLTNTASLSQFFPDEFINTHARFKTLTKNIRERRGEKVSIMLPLYMDENTKSTIQIQSDSALFPTTNDNNGHFNSLERTIYMDAMGFGMGCCCLQITFQAREIHEARRLYDQLAVICPIMLALTASTPIYRGYLSEVDCRWNVISASVDDRSEEERKIIPKSRYGSISRFISQDERLKPEYNNLEVPINMDCYNRLMEEGFDELLARHFAWLFVRDPLVIYLELLEQDNSLSSDHFENIQSTNWQTMRFKPPPAGNDQIGWRVEFRPMEVQPTDFENAAFSVFIVLLTRIIIAYNLNFYMPLSLVDENMQRAQKRDAIRTQLFYFPTDLKADGSENSKDRVSEMSIHQIINGDGERFPGLVPLIDSYLDSMNVDVKTKSRLSEYLKLLRERASGMLLTPASWMRTFVLNHKSYLKDSIVSPEITFDLIKEFDRIAHHSQSMSTVDFCCHYGKVKSCTL